MIFNVSGKQRECYLVGVGDKENNSQWEWETKRMIFNGSGRQRE